MATTRHAWPASADLAVRRGDGRPEVSQSTRSAGLARNWWAVGLRAVAAITFILATILLPRPTLAALIMMFAAYVAADGLLAIVAGVRAMRRRERWQTLIFEGTTNL